MSKLQNNRNIPVVYGSREVPNEDARLPKSMTHWFREFGITFDRHAGTGYGVRKSLKIGCGEPVRHFRALPHLGLLQVCDGYFDRWANSVGAETALPKSRAEFVAAIEWLLAEAVLAKIDPAVETENLTKRIERVEADIAEERLENSDLEYHVRVYGFTSKWVRNLWRRYQWRLGYSYRELTRLKGYLKYQQSRH
jgi:hypothetical protein